MSEELVQRNLIAHPEKIGKWDFYNIGATTLKSLSDYKIIEDRDYKELSRKKPDALIVSNRKVLVVIEHKIPTTFKSEKQKQDAIRQEISVAKALNAKLFIATDGTTSIWINPKTGNRIMNEDGTELIAKYDPKDGNTEKIFEKIFQSVNEKNDRLKPKNLVDPTGLAKQIWQDIWSVSGATPENCLYTFVELFIFKYLSDLEILKGIYSFDSLLKQYESNTAEEVLENYANVIRKKIKDLFPYGQDGTTIINGTIFVSKDDKAIEGYSTVFKKILERFRDYGKLEYIDHDFKSKLFESFLKESISKKNWGQYFTPLKVVRAIINMAEINEGMVIGDPACGVGKFLLEPILEDLNKFYVVKDGKLEPKVTLIGYDKGFDKDEQKTIILAKANMLIYFSDLLKDNSEITKQFSELFNRTFTLKTNSILGTLRDIEPEKYDLILTNPPYVVSGSSNLKEEIKKAGLSGIYTAGGIGVEGLFMEWIVKSLKSGGQAYVVVPDGFLIRQNDSNLRAFIKKHCYIEGIISLPLKTFFTTNKKTYVLAIRKKHDVSDNQASPVFSYLVSSIGETLDIYRFEAPENDLDKAVEMFNIFKAYPRDKRQSLMDSIIFASDPRCKLWPIEKFDPETEWSVDRWWSKEEKISIGISDESSSASVEEFIQSVKGLGEELTQFGEQISLLDDKKILTTKTIKVSELFEVKKGKSIYTKKYGSENKGGYPVYSASNNHPLTHIDSYDFDGRYLTWATNGFAGYMKVIDGKFSINGDRGLLVPKISEIDLDYIKAVLEPRLRDIAKGRKGDNDEDEFTKVYPWMLEGVELEIPIDQEGAYDLPIQKELGKALVAIQELKIRLGEEREAIQGTKIYPDRDYDVKNIPLGEIFDLTIGTNNSKFTKTFIKGHSGEIPVYSASKSENLVGYGYVADNLPGIRYFEDCLTWNIDGSIGYVFFRKGRFSLSEKVIPLILKREYFGKIDPIYLKSEIEIVAISRGFNWGNKAGSGKISSMEIPIPVKENGEFDFEKQKEIAHQHQRIQDAKMDLINKITRVESEGIRII